MIQQLKMIYDKLPKRYIGFVKYIPDRTLFGTSYMEYKDKISFDKHILNQNLLDTLTYAREHTAFGRDYIPNHISLENVRTVLESLPLISSSDLSKNLNYYISDEYSKKNSYLTTTGGTGRNPTSILLSNQVYGIEWAHMHNIWALADYQKQTNLKLTLRGKSLRGNRLIEYNPIYNELVVDTFKVKESNFEQFINEIKKYPIEYIHGYPSLVKEFMNYFNKYNYIPKIKGVFLGSEGATQEEKKNIADFFQTQVVHWYGQSERVALAVDSEANDTFKVYTSYGYPRVVDGELVATSFVNRALPLINYRMGDGAEIIEDEYHLYIKNIKGRWGKDFIYLSQSKKIPTSSINLHSSIQEEILFYQIIQKEFGKIEIRVLPKITKKINPKLLIKTLGQEMKENLKDFQIDINIVDDDAIQKSHRGKMILLVQELIIEKD